MKHSTIAIVSIVTALIIAGAVIVSTKGGARGEPSPNETLARCLTDTGTKFYGAFWCSHCQRQKALFGSAVHLLPYIECSLPDGSGVTEVCRAAGIEGYPTWVFPDGSRLSGEAAIETLAARSGCSGGGATTTTATASTTTPLEEATSGAATSS